MKTWAVGLLLFPILFACNSENSVIAPDSALPIDRLSGTWEDVEAHEHFVEQWNQNGQGGLIGKGYVLSGNDTVFIEQLSIEPLDSNWVYFANVNRRNQSTKVPFRLVTAEKNKFVFENKDHDFPQRIIYEFKNDSLIEQLIEGHENGNYRRRKVTFKRKS